MGEDSAAKNILPAPVNLETIPATPSTDYGTHPDTGFLITSEEANGLKAPPEPAPEPEKPKTLAKQYEAREKRYELEDEKKPKTVEDLREGGMFERTGFLTFVKGKEATFQLDTDTDEALYLSLQRLHDVFKSMDLDDPDDPNLTRLGKTLLRQFPLLKARAELLQGLQVDKQGKKTLNGQERIFQTQDELITALGVLEQGKVLTEAAFGQIITNNGKRAVETTINAKDFKRTFEEAKPHLPKRVHEQIAKLFEGRRGRTIEVAGSTGIAGLIGMFAAGGTPESAALALIGTTAGGLVGYHWEFFVGKKEDSITIKLSCLPSEARVVTSFAEKLGVLGWETKQVGEFITDLESARHHVWSMAGVNLRSANELAMIDLASVDPNENTTSMGTGRAKLYIERQTALEKMLGGRSLAELSPEDRIRFRLDATDTAAAKICGSEAGKVLDELTEGKKEGRETTVDTIEKIAQEVENGKRRIIEGPSEAQLKASIREVESTKTALETASNDVQDARTELDVYIKKEKEIIDHHTKLIAAQQKSAGLKASAESLRDSLGGTNGTIATLNIEIPLLRTLLNTETATLAGIDKKNNPTGHERQRIRVEKMETALRGKETARIKNKEELAHATAEEAHALAETKTLETEMKRLLGVFGLIHYKDMDIAKKITIARQKHDATEALRLDAEQKHNDAKAQIQTLESSIETPGERTPAQEAEDKQNAKYRRRIAKLARAYDSGEGEDKKIDKREEIKSKILDKKIPLSSLSAEGGEENWLKLFFGPENLSPEDQKINRRLCSRADMTMTAIEVWHLSDEFFGRDQNGKFKLAVVRENIDEIRSLSGKETKTAKTRIERLRKQNQQALTEMYRQVRQLFEVDVLKTIEYADTLIDRLTDKALTDPFGYTAVERVRPEMGIRKTGIHHQAEAGAVYIEPSHKVGAIEKDHGTIKYTTPEGYKNIAGEDVSIVIETSIKKPELSGDANSLEATLTTRDHTGAITSLPFEKQNTQAILRYLSLLETTMGWKDLDKLYPRAIGEMAAYLPIEKQAGLFENLNNVQITVSQGTSNYATYVFKKARTSGGILVSCQRTREDEDRPTRGREAINNMPLLEFVQKYEKQFKRIRHIRVDEPLTSARKRELKTELNEFLGAVGTEALKAMQRY